MAPRPTRAKKEGKIEKESPQIKLITKVNQIKSDGKIKEIEKKFHHTNEDEMHNITGKVNNGDKINNIKTGRKHVMKDVKKIEEYVKDEKSINPNITGDGDKTINKIKQKNLIKNEKENINENLKTDQNDESTFKVAEVNVKSGKTLKTKDKKKGNTDSDENTKSNSELEVDKSKVSRRKAPHLTDIKLDVSSEEKGKIFENENNTKEKSKRNTSQKKTMFKEDKVSTEEISLKNIRRGRGKKETVEKNIQNDLLSPAEDVEIKKGKGRKRAAVETKTESNTHVEKTTVLPRKKKTATKKESNSDCGPTPTQAAKGKHGGSKRTVKETAGDSNEKSEEPPTKKSKEKKPMNKTETSYAAIDFTNSSKNSQGLPWNLKICNWNVDGIRAWLNKGGLDYIKYEKPDILCLQEVKCSMEKLPKEVTNIPGYHPYWLCSDKDGYAGVVIYTSKMAISVQYGLKDEELDSEGRIITAEYEQFYLICTYVPNAGRKLVTLPKKLKWNEIFQRYVKELDAKKPVIICGDMNVAHNEIDLANPKTNKKNAGFTTEERDGMTALLNSGFVDTYRHLNPEKTGAYTFWTYMMNARAKNVGWRLDYMIVSERLLPALCDSVIRSEVYGSDHCPIALFLHLTSIPKIPSE